MEAGAIVHFSAPDLHHTSHLGISLLYGIRIPHGLENVRNLLKALPDIVRDLPVTNS
jgi:hypothetical protein